MSNRRHVVKATVYDKRGRILSEAYNSYDKTSPIQAKYGQRVNQPDRIYLHAELRAIIRVKNGSPYKIKVVRYDKNNCPKLAKPCPICELAIKEAGIKFVEYTVG